MAVLKWDVNKQFGSFQSVLTSVTFGDGQICLEGEIKCMDTEPGSPLPPICDSISVKVWYEGIYIVQEIVGAWRYPYGYLPVCIPTGSLPPGNYRIKLGDLFDKTFYYEGYGYDPTPPEGILWTGIDDKTWYKMQVLYKDGNYYAYGRTMNAWRVSATASLYINTDESWFSVCTFRPRDEPRYQSCVYIFFVREEGDYWIFKVSAGMIVEGSRFGFDEFVKVSKSKLSDWIIIRILQYLATEHADGNAAVFLSVFGRSKSYPKEEISRYCPRDPSYYGDLPDRVAKLKGYYDAMVEAANEAQQIYNEWVEWACFHCKAKLAYSQYDYDMCVSEWEQKLRGAYQKYISAKETRDVIIEDLKLEPLFYCFLEAFPEYAEYMKDPPIQTTLPDCSIPLPKLRNVVIDSNGIYFEYYAPTEITVLVCLGKVEDSTVRKIDCYELTAKPRWQSFSKEIHLVDGTYQLYFPTLLDYVNPITKVVSLPNIRITNVRYTVQNDQVVIKADAVPSDTCSYEIGLYYDTGEVITTETFYLKAGVVNEITFTVSLDKVRNRKVCIAPVGVEDIYATFWEDIECVG